MRSLLLSLGQLRTACAATLLFFALGADADQPTLEFSISGLRGELLENARVYLGDMPDTEYQRSYFLFSAERRIEESLNALGYYHPAIELLLEREQAVWQLEIRVDPGERVRLTEIDVRVDGEASLDPDFELLLQTIPIETGSGLHPHPEDLADF